VCVLLFAKEPLYPLLFLFIFLVLLEFIGTAAAVEDCCHQAERGSAPHSTSFPHSVSIFPILRALKKNLAAAAADDHVRSEEEEEEESF